MIYNKSDAVNAVIKQLEEERGAKFSRLLIIEIDGSYYYRRKSLLLNDLPLSDRKLIQASMKEEKNDD